MANRLLRVALAMTVALLILSSHFHVSAAAENTGVSPGSDAVPSRVIIADLYVEGGGLTAGETCTAVFVLKNTSETSGVTGVLVSGWIGDGEPVEFDGVNQVYVPFISPGSEASVEFMYFTGNVDLASTTGITAGFTISYKDEGAGIDRTNNVSVRLPVLHKSYTAVSEADMRWPEPVTTAFDAFLTARFMQAIYLIGLVFCCTGSVFLLLLKKKTLHNK